jgi:hypothetical protein
VDLQKYVGEVFNVGLAKAVWHGRRNCRKKVHDLRDLECSKRSLR